MVGSVRTSPSSSSETAADGGGALRRPHLAWRLRKAAEAEDVEVKRRWWDLGLGFWWWRARDAAAVAMVAREGGGR